MNKFIIIALCTVLVSCSGVKLTQKKLASGDYNFVVNEMVNTLRKGKTKKKSYELILLLEEAFKKAVDRDELKIRQLKAENNSFHLKTIYKTYIDLENRNRIIKPLLPLYIRTQKRNASFALKDYTEATLQNKKKLSEYLYTNALVLLKKQQQLVAREAYNDLVYLNSIHPNYKDVKDLIEQAHFIGTDYVLVHVRNASDKVIPIKLEKDLLNIASYKLNNFWTVYQNNKNPNINYSYDLVLSFNHIEISPEQIKEKEIIQEKIITDGFEYVLDGNGNVQKDSLGNDLKQDKLVKLRSKVSKFSQFKSVAIQARATYFIANTDEVIESFPIVSEFVFEHHFARHSGNKKALNKAYLRLIRNKRIPFPTSEELIYEAGEDIKNQLKEIITRRN
jgi:hypothetical protein